MRFDELDKKMRVYETSMEQKIIPGIYIVARLDGRGFTKLTKEVLELERPFDSRFRDAMTDTVERLMNCGFRIIYAYTESDEISLLFHLDENVFERKVRKITSILAGEASAAFSLAMKNIGVFDCRICPLPTKEVVIDYFRWRQEDASRNALNAYCYWKLREEGKTKTEATNMLSGLSVADKNELLFQVGINFNEVPLWQKRGIGFYYEGNKKLAYNPQMNKYVEVNRSVLKKNTELPMGIEYSLLVDKILNTDRKEIRSELMDILDIRKIT